MNILSKRTMKTITLLLMLIPMIATAQTKASGKVIADEPYEVWINDHYKDGSEFWIRWEMWEYYQDYMITAKEGQEIKSAWISQCTGDTLAKAVFYGSDSRFVVSDTIYLDGSVYTFGKN